MRTNVLLALLLMLCVGCRNGSVDVDSVCDSDTVATTVIKVEEVTLPTDTVPLLSVQQIDSLRFRLTHHYTENFNFLVKADSLRLLPRQGDISTDTCTVRDGDLIVVAQIHLQMAQDSLEEDTFWVKVARDQQTMGWVDEPQLLRSVVPDDPISQLLDFLTHSRGFWMTLLIVLGIAGVWIARRYRQRSTLHPSPSTLHAPRFTLFTLPSPYPTLLLILVAITASLYASVQNFAPEYWLEYYFHPTMNPLLLPPVMATLVTLVWLLLIVSVAVVLEVYRYFSFTNALLYLFQLAGCSMVVYLLTSWTTLIYVGYLLLPLFILVMLHIYRHRIRCTLRCGHCGCPMRQKGSCPVCGAVND